MQFIDTEMFDVNYNLSGLSIKVNGMKIIMLVIKKKLQINGLMFTIYYLSQK